MSKFEQMRRLIDAYKSKNEGYRQSLTDNSMSAKIYDAMFESIRSLEQENESLNKRIAELESWVDRYESYQSEQREYGPD